MSQRFSLVIVVTITMTISLLRGRVALTRYKLAFNISLSDSTYSKNLNPDKVQLRETIFELRAQGWSFRQIAQVVGLHWTRIQQIVNKNR
jgi:hypothetical protein